MSFVANTALPLLHTVGFLTNDSVWGSTYSIWPAQWQMTDGERPELKAPSVLNANFSAVTQAWTNNGIAYASSYLVGHTQKYVMVDIEQSGWDRFLYWDTAEGQLPNGSFVRGPEYNAKDAQRAAAGLTSMADAFAGSSLGAADKYQFGIYNAPGVGGTDVSACLSGAFSREEMYARFLNSSSWFPPALNAALSYLCPEVYPCSSYAMVWKDMVAYNLTRFAYDYAHIVGTAAVRAFPDDVARLRPVVKSTFEVKSFDTTAPVTWPYMGIRTAYTAQLCALRDVGIRQVIYWKSFGSLSAVGSRLWNARNQQPLDATLRTRWLGLSGLSGEPITAADLDATPPRSTLVAKLTQRLKDDLAVAKRIFGAGEAEVEEICAGLRPQR
jgi:hypothetical protein